MPEQTAHALERRAPALRSMDARDGLSPSRRLVQYRQEGRACGAPLLPRGACAAAPMSASAAACRDRLRVGGFVPFTSTDYPGALAAVVFCQGCPWRCG